MFSFEHDAEEVNLIIQSLEHKIRSMQAMLQKFVAQAQAQAQAQVQDAPATAPVPSTEETSPNA
jgi:hypothetical protein